MWWRNSRARDCPAVSRSASSRPPAPPGARSRAPPAPPPLPPMIPLMLDLDFGVLGRTDIPNLSELKADVKIPALLIIPGNVGFLKQFFSAQLFVANGSPGGSP